MARRRGNTEEDTKKLVKSLTGFQEEDENYTLCVQFVQSNLKYHKFLDADSHKITRTVDGIYEKLAVHSQESKAEAWKRTTAKFLESPFFEHRDTGKTETHYRMLSLLLSLADAPTRHTFKEKKTKHITEEKDDFDWRRFLLEGEDIYRGPYLHSPDFSDDDDDDEDNGRDSHHVHFPHQATAEPPGGEGPKGEDRRDDEGGGGWLRRNLVVQYWTDSPHQTLAHSNHRSSSLHSDWEDYLSSANPLYVSTETWQLSEHNIIREVLWMLLGTPQSFVYYFDGSSFQVQPHIQLSHLSTKSLSQLLDQLANYGNIVHKLNTFVEWVAMGDICCYGEDNGNHGDNMVMPQTYQAYASTLMAYLGRFKAHIIQTEKSVIKQEETWTLSHLIKTLKLQMAELDMLNHIQSLGIEPWRDNEPAMKASRLLGVLYETLVHSDTMGLQHTHLVALLLPLWVQASKPYWDIVDNWISTGDLRDPKREFFIRRNDSVQSLDETFWETAFTIQCSGSASHSLNDRNQKSSQFFAPSFLSPVLEKVVLAGKSMELLQNLGKLGAVVKETGYGNFKRRETLYETFLRSLNLELESKSLPGGSINKPPVGSINTPPGGSINTPPGGETTESLVFTHHIAHQMMVKGIQDPLLRLNFNALFVPSGKTTTSLGERENEIQKELSELSLSQLSPMQLILERSLYPYISQRYDKACSALLLLLKEEHTLLHYFTAIRKFYLMEAGDVMYDFYTAIFEKLRLQEPWQDVSFLNMLLQEAVQIQSPADISRLFVSFEDQMKKSRDRTPISALEGLTLHYKVAWPVDVVVNSRCMAVYNKVLTFLLQIKRAKYCLDGLRFDDLEKEDLIAHKDRAEDVLNLAARQVEPPAVIIHAMHMFRVRLMHFVNSLHNYIMTRILQSTGLEFQQAILEARDLDQVIAVHNHFVSTIYERCLLHKKVSFVKQAVNKVLNLAILFQAKWDEGVDNISMKSVQEMEGEFSRCIHFLSSLLNNVIKRGSFPHLESLAFALITSSEQTVHS